MNSIEAVELPITDYQGCSNEELFERTRAAKKSLGDQVLILGHNYQRDEVIVHADLRGDSLLLSKWAAERSEHPYVVFCGVHFMAETADILSRSKQTVILPDLAAGCSMADMAVIEQVDDCWEALGTHTARRRLRDPRGLCQFCSDPQSVLWRAWRNHVYLLQRQGHHGLGLVTSGENSFFPG